MIRPPECAYYSSNRCAGQRVKVLQEQSSNGSNLVLIADCSLATAEHLRECLASSAAASCQPLSTPARLWGCQVALYVRQLRNKLVYINYNLETFSARGRDVELLGGRLCHESGELYGQNEKGFFYMKPPGSPTPLRGAERLTL